MNAMTRRTALAASAAALAAGSARAQARRPLVIAHRGASGVRPEHTLMAYREAIAQGADYIEPDLVATKDGHLVARHENEIRETTDVASRPEFAGRKTTKVIDGEQVTGWFTEDFTLAELKTLRARERLPALRPLSKAFDGQEPIVTYQEVIDLARAETRRLNRTIGTYPEMKHPAYFAGIGLPLEGRLADILKRNQLDSSASPVFVQSFEPESLKRFGAYSLARRVMLVSRGPGPVDVTSEAGLKAISAFAEGVGPEWPLVIPVTAEGALGPPTPLIARAKALKLDIHPWTVRAENTFLPRALQRGDGPAAHGDAGALLAALYGAGATGVFSDFPDQAVAARARMV